MFNSFSSLFAPIIGALIYDYFGYNNVLDYMMEINLIFCFIYMIFNCGINVFKDFKKEKI